MSRAYKGTSRRAFRWEAWELQGRICDITGEEWPLSWLDLYMSQTGATPFSKYNARVGVMGCPRSGMWVRLSGRQPRRR